MIYLDYNATTPCAPEVVAAMLPYFTHKFGNPASRTHAMGWQADEAVQIAKRQVAALIGAAEQELIFTSGATESCNLALKGVFEVMKGFGNHIITCRTEHKAVLDTCTHLEQSGARITYLEVNREGHIDLEALEEAFTPDTILIALMYANNETGVLHPVKEIGMIAKKHKVYFFCDATQAIGKVAVNVEEDGIDLLALSAHKFYGPKGIGVLYTRRRSPRVQLIAQMDGGGHQNGFRSGTLNVPAIVGLGKAAALSQENRINLIPKIGAIRDAVAQQLLQLEGAVENGDVHHRLPHVLNIAFEGIKAERLVSILNNEIAFSVGSACTSAQQKSSHVLEGMHLPPSVIEGSIRLSFGQYNTMEEAEIVAGKITQAVNQLKIKS
ncbi:IscS subfamily cysteine desulfurase [Taibaiella sp. KBW10]|uniref:cysteine desulfurase family protein n=1 Tax=Taibaiella sp. KBW10 TaxID=2153357 RepID=UPI000F5A56B9|nr:cysteine desulfurase family protein [Taibaiella sp. KBW10]RQO30053.1 IscS subfamily cysteine desulfurase [Taibaiella sp. KBW10]